MYITCLSFILVAEPSKIRSFCNQNKGHLGSKKPPPNLGADLEPSNKRHGWMNPLPIKGGCTRCAPVREMSV